MISHDIKDKLDFRDNQLTFTMGLKYVFSRE